MQILYLRECRFLCNVVHARNSATKHGDESTLKSAFKIRSASFDHHKY